MQSSAKKKKKMVNMRKFCVHMSTLLWHVCCSTSHGHTGPSLVWLEKPLIFDSEVDEVELFVISRVLQ